MYCHSVQDRQYLFQEILSQLWKAFPTFSNEANISTWMYRIALNTAISFAISVGTAIFTIIFYLFNRWYIHRLYGRYIQKLKNLLLEMEE
jgi:hypothetical protein